jgi:PKD repeat protein
MSSQHHSANRLVRAPTPRAATLPLGGATFAFLATLAALLVLAACSEPGAAGTANLPPAATFTASVTEGPAPLTVSFDARASSDPDGVIATFAWEFGDGAAGTGATTAHTYANAGTYVVRLTVTDDRGATGTAQQTITVRGDDDGEDGDDGDDGEDDANGGDDGGEDDAGDPGDDEETGIGQVTFAGAYGASESALELVGLVVTVAIDAALEATRLNAGAATLTGSVTESSPGSFTYAAEPADRLRVTYLDGRLFEVVFNAAPTGDFAGDGARYLRNPHQLDVRFTSNAAANALDLTLVSRPAAAPNTQVATLNGGFTSSSGARWSADLTIERFQRSSADLTGNEFETILSAGGQLGSETLGVQLTLGRYYRYILVNTAENVDHRFDHTLVHGDRSYRFAGRVFVGLLNSQPVDRDQWVIDGGLVEGEALVATLTATEDVTGLTIWLDFGGDERTRLLFFGYL